MSSAVFDETTDMMLLLDTLLGTTVTNNNAFRLPVSEAVVASFIQNGIFGGRFADPSTTAPLDQSLVWPDKNSNPTVYRYWDGAAWVLANFSDIWEFTASLTGTEVQATSIFGTDNLLLRSDGDQRMAQGTGITVDDSDEMSGVTILVMSDGGSGLSLLRRINSTGIFHLSGGAGSASGSGIRLYGPTASNARDIDFRVDSTIVGGWDNSDDQWEWANKPLNNIARLDMNAGPQIHAGSGTPESSVTAPIGSVYLRSNGSVETAVYVKESGAGNTGWAAVKTTGVNYTEWDKGALAANTLFSQAHSAGAVPKSVLAYIECTTADAQYAVGDRIAVHGKQDSAAAGGWTPYADSTNIYLATGSSFGVMEADATNAATLTTTSWKVILAMLN